jgi:hypothetical protein
MSPVCEVKPPQQVEGLTSKQKALLKSRDRSSDPEERWSTMYKICFPDDEIIPDPCERLPIRVGYSHTDIF